jgi:transposase
MLVAEEAVEIRVLRRQGKSIREIARLLGVSRNTVRRYLRGGGPPHYEREARPGKLEPYKHYIAERVEAAAPEWIPAPVLLRKLKARALSGRDQHPQGFLATLKPVATPEPLIRFETEPGRRCRLTSRPSGSVAIGCRFLFRRSAGAGRLMSSSSPTSGWRRCLAATSGRFGVTPFE